MNSSGLKYFSQLDGLRAFAIVFVMIGHWISWDTPNEFLKNAPWGHGVILFFVLSGYLISNILFEQKEKIDNGTATIGESLRTFYFRRFIRIFPIYYILIIYLYNINFSNTRDIFPWLITYTSNLLQCSTGEYVGDFNHFWSLAVEEQFYLIWPFIIFFVDNKNIYKVILAFMIVSFISRVSCYFVNSQNWMLSAYFTPNLFLPLCLGALLAYAKRYNERFDRFFTNPIILYISIMVYILFYFVFHYKLKLPIFDFLFDEYLFALASLFVIARASSNNFKFLGKHILEHDIMVFTGKISYGLYVFHLFVINFFWNYIAIRLQISIQNKTAIWLTYFAIAFILAIISYYFIEKPINKMKNYFKY